MKNKDNEIITNKNNNIKNEIDNNQLKDDKNKIDNNQNIEIENNQYFDEDDDFDEDNDEDNESIRASFLKMDAIKAYCSKNKKAVIIALIILGVVIIGIPVFIILGNNFNSTNAEISSEVSDENARNQNEYVSIVPVEVGEENDPEDPQLENGNTSDGVGAVINANDLKNVGNSSSSNGIDVSKYQGKIDWTAVAASGIDFAMVRIGYRTDKTGIIYEDLYARYNMQKAAEAGIKVGIYFFSTATSREEALEEAAWTSDYISTYSITYPVVYNCEGFTASDSRMYGINNADRTAYAMAFLNYVKNEGYEPMLYAAKSELENSKYWDTSKISASYKIWIAQYPSIPYPQTTAPTYQGSYAMWQYTSKGVVSGISSSVDINVAYFSYDSVAEPKDASGIINADNPELGITFTAVNDQMTAKELTNLRSLPSTSGSIVASITNGQFVTRVGMGDNGWSKITYNGQTVYALTNYLTTEVKVVPEPTTAGVEDGITFTAANDQVTAKEKTNLRTGPNTGSESVGMLNKGTFYTRTGVGDNGWSRLDFDGRIVYAKTDNITTEVLKVEEPETTSDVGMKFTTVNEQVTAKEKTNLRALPNQETTTVIIVELKNGEYVTKTGESSTGWSRLEYNGQTVYAVTSLLIN